LSQLEGCACSGLSCRFLHRRGRCHLAVQDAAQAQADCQAALVLEPAHVDCLRLQIEVGDLLLCAMCIHNVQTFMQYPSAMQVHSESGDAVAAFLALQQLAAAAPALPDLMRMQSELALLAQGEQQRRRRGVLQQGRSATPLYGSLYEALGVPAQATPQDVRSAYRRQAARWHPDKWMHAGSEERAEAEARFGSVQEAYATLSDVHKRCLYDADLVPA
jgi:DnaJ-domain-containing protein 1